MKGGVRVQRLGQLNYAPRCQAALFGDASRRHHECTNVKRGCQQVAYRFAKKVTIQPCNIGMGYFYKGLCFAYVWATQPFTDYWWRSLCLIAGIEHDELLKGLKAVHSKNPTQPHQGK